jgi:hypothetical protein
MGTPITWRNVTGPSLADAAKPLAYAQSAFTGGMDALDTALKGYQTGQEKIWKQQDLDATNALKAQLYGATTPEQFAALKASGVLSQTIAPNGARIDRGVLDPLVDGRLAALQQQDKTNAEYAISLTDRADAPSIAQAKAMLLAGNVDGAKAILPNLSTRGQNTLAEAIDARAQIMKDRGYKDNEEAFKEKQRPLTLKELDSRIANNNASTAANIAQKNLAMQQLVANNVSTLDGKIAGLQETWNSTAGQKQIQETLNSIKDPDDREYAANMLKVLEKNPDKYKNITATQVAAALTANSRAGWFDRTFSMPGSNFESTIESYLPAAADLAKTREQQLANLRAQREVANGQYNSMVGIPNTPAPLPAAPAAAAAPGTPAPVAAPAPGAPTGAAYVPQPGTPQEIVDRVLKNAKERAAAQAPAAQAAEAAIADKAARANEISWLTTNEVSIMKPKEAAQYLMKYQDVLPGGPNGRLARALRQRM